MTRVQHKTFIKVDEVGCEATGVSCKYLRIFLALFFSLLILKLPTDLSVGYMSMSQYTFQADHPFVFIIRDQNAVYFTGHVVKF